MLLGNICLFFLTLLPTLWPVARSVGHQDCLPVYIYWSLIKSFPRVNVATERRHNTQGIFLFPALLSLSSRALKSQIFFYGMELGEFRSELGNEYKSVEYNTGGCNKSSLCVCVYFEFLPEATVLLTAEMDESYSLGSRSLWLHMKCWLILIKASLTFWSGGRRCWDVTALMQQVLDPPQQTHFYLFTLSWIPFT